MTRDDLRALLQASTRTDGAFDGRFPYGGRNIPVCVDPDGESLDDTLAFAARVLSSLTDFDDMARALIVDEFLDAYNDDWRGEETGAPILTRAEFSNAIRLDAVNFLTSSGADFFYNDGDMFGGHSLIAMMFDGQTFSNVTMYG